MRYIILAAAAVSDAAPNTTIYGTYFSIGGINAATLHIAM